MLMIALSGPVVSMRAVTNFFLLLKMLNLTSGVVDQCGFKPSQLFKSVRVMYVLDHDILYTNSLGISANFKLRCTWGQG